MVERFNRNAESFSVDFQSIALLKEEKIKLQEIVDSQVPAQIDQQFKSALNAHAKVYETIKTRENEETVLIEEYKDSPFGEIPIEKSADLSEQLVTWISKVPYFEKSGS